MEAEELPEHALAAERVAHGHEIHERGIGVGRLTDRRQQPWRDGGQKVTAPPRGEKPNLFLAKGHQRPVRGRHVPEAVPREHLLHEVCRRVGVEHEIGLRLGGRVVGKCVVQQVVEDAAIQGRGLRQIGAEPGRCVARRAVPQPCGEPGELRFGGRQQVGLPVGEQLEPMFDGAQERVGAFEDLPLLVGEAASLREPADRLERAAGANPRRVAAVQELEELDRELDVTDAAAAMLDVGGIDPLPHRPLLDPPLERLDARDVGPRQPAAIDPRRKLVKQPVPQRLVARDAAGLHPGLSLPGAAALVVIQQHRVEAEGRRARRPMRPQSQIDAVGRAQVGPFADQPHRLLNDPVEELLVRAGLRPVHAAVGRIHEHEVDVARIVELVPAELAERDRRDRRPLASGAARHAPLPFHARNRRRHRRLHDAVGHVGDLAHDGLQPLPPHEVAVGDAECFPPLEPSQRPQHTVRVGRGACRRHADLGRERRRQRLLLLGPSFAEPDLLPRLGVGDHQLREEGARREQLHEDAEGPRIALEERRGGQRAPHAADEPFDRHEHAIGVADLGQQVLELVAHACEQVEREAPFGEGEQHAMRGGSIGEPRRRGPRSGRRRVVEQLRQVGGRLHPHGWEESA